MTVEGLATRHQYAGERLEILILIKRHITGGLMRETTLVFDLDGTLVDTAPDLIASANHVLAGEGLAPVSGGILRPWIGHGARSMIVESLAVSGRGATSAEIDRMLERFLLYYAENVARESRPYPGAAEALDECAARGATLAICTNKREALALALLRILGLDRRFAFIAGRDTFPVSKPHPDHLLNTIFLSGGDPARAVMIGDSSVDAATAKAANVPIVAVTFGYNERPVSEFDPDATIDHFNDLVPALEGLMERTKIACEAAAGATSGSP